jgi:hypothetical protein
VLSTPPAFVLSQNQTLQTKTPRPNEAEFESEKSDLTKTTPKTGITKTTPLNGKKRRGKKQQTKTTKHTIEFSNNTPAWQATLPLYSIRRETSSLVRQSISTGAVGF